MPMLVSPASPPVALALQDGDKYPLKGVKQLDDELNTSIIPSSALCSSVYLPSSLSWPGQRHITSLHSVSNLFKELHKEREWVQDECNGVFKERMSVASEIRDVDRMISDLQEKKYRLKSKFVHLTERESDLKRQVEVIDAKLVVVGEESASFERKIREIKGQEEFTFRKLDSDNVEPHRCIETIYGHSKPISAVQYDDISNILVTGSGDHTIQIYDCNKRDETPRRWVGHGGWIHCLQFKDDVLYSGGGDNLLKRWNLQTGELSEIYSGHTSAVSCVQFDDDTAVSGSSDNTLVSWDIHTSTQLLTMEGHTSYITCCQMWKYALASGSGDNSIRMWDVRTGKCHRWLNGHQGPVTCLQFDDHQVVSGSKDHTVRVWDLRTGNTLSTLTFPATVNDVRFNGDIISIATSDSDIKLFDRKTHVQRGQLSGHLGSVRCLSLSGDSLASGSSDRSVRLWSVSSI
eukprot:GFYU01001719.1.p1 GENE.GFYU01001719.1~~GFYU01001719.1.p1  ORF type:complete len:461 (+),score=68.94 GFYU01001719.1:143-1525(+)